ncbi:hypothetical protein [Tenacibaculum sp. 47A_GOM-205m]|uniref:hypothetical protein n=1 Tax=Tenacibaculum sp. 47A_GOM-205m TaxID=1380384 RepID=UPI00048D4DEB|nr:hypothetical protein [Tenacibaculum sp. 47A_GOM-205m]
MEKLEWQGDQIIEGVDPLIYLTANKFYETSKIVHHSFIEPKIMNLSFSIELYLKSLNTKTTISKKGSTDFDTPILERKLETTKGHELDLIFNRLKPKDQNNLTSLYLEKYNSNFRQDLFDIKNAFIDYRYSFEKDSLTISLTIIERLADFLKEYIENEMKQSNFSR